MSNKKVTWVGDEKALPIYGMATTGRHIVMFESDANSYIKQGFAKPFKPAKKEK